MHRRFGSRPRARLALIGLLALLGLLAPRAQAFTNGQAASLVLGQPDFVSGTSAATPSGMSQPSSVAVDPITGKVFVADTSNFRVLRFASSAALASGAAAEAVLGQPNLTSSTPALSARGMGRPIAVAIDGAEHLWVADYANHRVLRFDGAAYLPNGAPASGVLGQPDFTSSTSTAAANAMRYPMGVAVDGSGHLWVADNNNSRVLRFDGAANLPNGAPASGVLGQGSFVSNVAATSSRGMSHPIAVAVDSAGRLWVADAGNSRVLRFDGAATLANGAAASGVLGQVDFTSSVQTTGASGMSGPYGVAVGDDGRVWVTDTTNHRVLRFDGAATLANGAAASGVLGQPDFTASAPTTSAAGMYYPEGVTVESDGSLWVADNLNHRVLRFDKTAQTITFAALSDRTLGEAPFTISATASSGLGVTLTSSTPDVCTVSGTTVTLVAVGTCTLAADQGGDPDYQPAPQVARSFRVKVPQAIAFAALPDRTVGNPPFTLSATASSGLAVTFSSSTPAVCTVSGATVTLVAAGTCTIVANQAGDSSYTAAQVTRAFTVLATASRPSVAYLPLVVRTR